MDPILVEVTRGEVVEARHRVHACVVRDGEPQLVAGDPEVVCFLRSAAKPVQALPVVRACPSLDDAQIVLCCASHLARPEQLEVVRRTLELAGATEEHLACGPDPTPLEHTCSGKHAGFLALCSARGWPLDGYEQLDHPCQIAMREELAAVAGLEPDALPVGVDGCGVPTFAVPLRVAASLFVRLRERDGAERVIGALQRRHDLLRGPVAADAVAMRLLEGWIAKGGAEGLFCASAPDGLGVALKVEDGAFRAIRPALDLVLRRLGRACDGLASPRVVNSRGVAVGWIEALEAP
ncbi:MAG: asparaginase [Gaiella sp.]